MTTESSTHIDSNSHRERNFAIDDLDRAIVSLAARINADSRDHYQVTVHVDQAAFMEKQRPVRAAD